MSIILIIVGLTGMVAGTLSAMRYEHYEIPKNFWNKCIVSTMLGGGMLCSILGVIVMWIEHPR